MRLGTKVESNKLTAKCVMMNDIVSRTRNLNFFALGPRARLIIENSKYLGLLSGVGSFPGRLRFDLAA